MQYPTRSRSNMRHRGPVESQKFSRDNNEIWANFYRLYMTLLKQREVIKDMQRLLREGSDGGNTMDEIHLGTEYEAPGLDVTSRQIKVLERRIKRLQGGMTNG